MSEAAVAGGIKAGDDALSAVATAIAQGLTVDSRDVLHDAAAAPLLDATMATEGAVAETPFGWVGSPWSLTGACLFNAAMTVATIGVYSFWGRTEIRRRLWSSVRLKGEPLVYHGTGFEMFKGFTAALLVVLLPLFLFGTFVVIWYGQASGGWGLYQSALFLVVYPVLKSLATYRARRYRLGRTSWRGIRGSATGSSGEFAFLSWATSLLYPLTLGWIAPWRALYIQRFLIGDTMLGDRQLEMKGSTGSLYLRFGLLWIATIGIVLGTLFVIGHVFAGADFTTKVPGRMPVDFSRVTRAQWLELGGTLAGAIFVWSLISSFYRSSLYNLTANATVMLPPANDPAAGNLRFKLTTRGPRLIWLFVTNQLLTYGTLFVLRPIATARTMRYFTKHLTIVGSAGLERIGRNPNSARAEGEGLAQAFDFDAF